MDLSLLLLAQAAAPDPADVAVGSVWDFIVKGGWMMLPIGLCSLAVIAVGVERSIVLRRTTVAPANLTPELIPLLARGAKRDALALLDRAPSPLSRILREGAQRLGRPIASVEKHMVSQGEHEIAQLRRRLRTLSVVAAVAPLLGLLGTIFGMIKAFQTVALSGEALGRTELLAEGIYEAMITTAAGLVVAIPALVLHHFFVARIETLTRLMDAACVEAVEAIASATGEHESVSDEDHEPESYPVRAGVSAGAGA